jgi:protoheme IX farnesyltransferase
MLPVVSGEAATRRPCWLYTLALLPVSLAPSFPAACGPLYLAVALAANAAFLHGAWGVARRDPAAAAADRYRAEKRLFGVSILYLFALFGGFLGEAALRGLIGPSGWPVWL